MNVNHAGFRSCESNDVDCRCASDSEPGRRALTEFDTEMKRILSAVHVPVASAKWNV